MNNTGIQTQAGPVQEADTWDELESEYQFFRPIVKNNIFLQPNAEDRSNLSSWLHKCDVEKNQSLRCGFIKLMLVSLQHPGGNFTIFRQTAPLRHLPYLENTPLFLSEVVEDELSRLREYHHRRRYRGIFPCHRAAAVSADLTSFATSVANSRKVQVFYARSDNPINTWTLPTHVLLPVNSRSATDWERALSAPLKSVKSVKKPVAPQNLMHTKDGQPIFIPSDFGYWNMSTEFETEMTPMERACRRLMGEQIPLVVPKKEEFYWYEHSRLGGTLLPTNDICIDKDTCGHEKTQLELDERAINTMNKVYPGCIQLVLDSRFIADVIGVNPTNEGYNNGLNDHKMTLNIDAIDCKRPSRDAKTTTTVGKHDDEQTELCDDRKNASPGIPRTSGSHVSRTARQDRWASGPRSDDTEPK